MQKSNHTQVPNDLFDKYLSELKGSEIQVFLIICRKTRGWHKETDPISTSQLIELTGLSNRSVIDASKSLEEKGLINCKRRERKPTIYEIAYEESSQDDEEVVKEVHKGYEESSQDAYEDSSHTKEKSKETKQKKSGCPPSSDKIPTLQEVKAYFKENGYDPKVGVKAFNYYQTSVEGTQRQYWRDSKGNKIRNWKMKMQAVWFRDENEIKSQSTTPMQLV